MSTFTIANPGIEDGAAIKALLSQFEPYVGTSPCYTYLMICRYFSSTSFVAKNNGGEVIGVVTGFMVPDRPETYFVWEIAISECGHHHGLSATQLLVYAFEKLKPTFYEATVGETNEKAIDLFRRLSSYLSINIDEDVIFPPNLFLPHEHEAERLVRLGPIDWE